MSELRAVIAEQILKCAPLVEERIVTAMVEREVVKRGEAIGKCLDKLMKAENDQRKIKPDIIAYDAAGTKVSENWSKERLEELNKSKQRIEKLTRAIDKALDKKPDFSDVYNLASSGD